MVVCRSRNYFICTKSNYPWIVDFTYGLDLTTKEVIENFPSTIRRNNDDTKFIVKAHTDDVVPSWLHADDNTPLTKSEMLTELQNEEWQEE
jgi:hypothetical protein